MAEINNVIAEASQDLQTIEDFVNLPADSEVYPRLLPSVNVGTLAGTRDAIFEAGGLPATPFPTKALMEVGELADGKYAQVTDDSVAENNGLYIKTAGAWVRSDYDPVLQSSTYTDARFNKEVTPSIATSSNTSGIARLVDANGNVVARIDGSGDVYLAGSANSIQHEMLDTKSKTDQIVNSSIGSDIHRLVDANGNVVARVTADGDLRIKGIDSSVQSLLKKVTEPPKRSTYDKSNDVNDVVGIPSTASANAIVKYASVFNKRAEIPNFMFPQDIEYGVSWIDSVKAELGKAEDRVVMSGYQPSFSDDVGMVHPQSWEFRTKVAGFKYWLGINPYTNGNANIELPFIYGSNDPELKQWELIPEFPQPFEVDPDSNNTEGVLSRSHLSDSGFTYDVVRGDLVYFWRKSLHYPEGVVPAVKVSIGARSFDGENWSDIFDIVSLGAFESDGPVSPAIVFNPANNLYYIYYSKSGSLFYCTASDIRNAVWSEPVACNTGGLNKMWHLDLKYIGDKLVLLAHQDTTMSGASNDAFVLAISSDFVNFTPASGNINTNTNAQLYKATLMPNFTDENNASFKVLYTSDHQTSPQYQFFVTTTNNVKLGA